MERTNAGNPLSGKTLRWTFERGSMAGKTFEHHFYADGTVTYRTVDDSQNKPARGSPAGQDRPKYKAFEIADGVVLVSYLADSGYTLTVALNFGDGRAAGFASNHENWFPCEGTFEEVTAEARRAA